MRLAGEPEDDWTDEMRCEVEALDFSDIGRRVKAEVEALFASADDVYVDLLDLATDQDWEPAESIIDNEREIPRSPDELIAQLNGIAAVAFRLARLMRPLMQSRAAHLAARADREAGRPSPPAAPKS